MPRVAHRRYRRRRPVGAACRVAASRRTAGIEK